MGLSVRESQDKIAAYEAGQSNDLAGVSDSTAERLRSERSRREELHRTFEARQAAESQRREEMLRSRYMASGGTPEGWARDRARILSDDAINAMQRQSGSLLTPAEFLA